MTGFPLPLRNALAELTLAAFADATAVAALEWLAWQTDPPPSAAADRLVAVHLVDPGGDALLPVHAPHAHGAATHAARALRAVRSLRRDTATDPIARACAVAAALWDEQLFFEVHEVLEDVWRTATGPERQALQGVIQIAVAFHHLAHQNRRGARSLLVEGRSRIASVPPSALPSLDLERLLADTASWQTALEGTHTPSSVPPRLGLRSG